jgi:hypothetical protein
VSRISPEVSNRTRAGTLADEILYPADTQWSGLYDRMIMPTPEETGRRRGLAAFST